MHFKVEALNSYCWTLTTSKKNKGWSKLGFFCVFLMTVEWTTCPPHSNSILGDATLASWYLFMLRTPQHNTCGRKHHSKTLFTWSGGPRSSGVGFFCFVSPRAWKQKKPTPLDRGLPLYVNRPKDFKAQGRRSLNRNTRRKRPRLSVRLFDKKYLFFYNHLLHKDF